MPESDSLLIPALSALVLRQAKRSLIEHRIITGVSQKQNMPIGLQPEDRKAMALVSRACLANGLPDHGAEIHHLLSLCSKPLGNWLSVPEVMEQGLESVCLIYKEEGLPTEEAEDLAGSFSTLTANLEEQLFSNLHDALAKQPKTLAEEYYTLIRDFVVRNPMTTEAVLHEKGKEMPAIIWKILNQLYESVPESWAIDGKVPVCGHCGNAMKQGKASLVCRLEACSATHPSKKIRRAAEPGELIRAKRGVRKYWIEPGLDEILLYDNLLAMGIEAQLYPHQDRVDVAVGDIGIDLKAYASPETLGNKFKKSLGGLHYYPEKWVVIPNRFIKVTPSYLERLVFAMERPNVVCLTVSDAIHHFRVQANA
ncbi:MAG: hypothetical protein JAY63_10790 [Candidatus Thiodiazotropha taylori]|nr:hypothetical protein [Candidatus Thiodiazotropha taylori]